jgi:type VI secretion system protein ImpG
MHPHFLEFYSRELQYIRELGGEFAQDFPKIAGRLGLDGFECADPYVERLIESFAFMAARVHLKMECEFPKFTDHLLHTVFPQYLAPIPSMAIAQFSPDLSEGTLKDGFRIARGTPLKSLLGPNDQTPCEYRTCHDVDLWPIECTEASYVSREAASAKLPPGFQNAKAVIRIKLEVTGGNRFPQLKLNSLPIFLRGNSARTNRLYEQLFSDAMGVLIQSNAGDSEIALRSPIAPLGFDDEQSMLPSFDNMFKGYRLLIEYFTFQQRFQFFRVEGLQEVLKSITTKEIDLLIPLKRLDPQLENLVDASNIGLFCTPIINLFPHRADRIHLHHGDHEHHIVPDRTRPMDFEVYSVLQVDGYGQNLEKAISFKPFYDIRDSELDGPNVHQDAFFSISRTMRILSTKQRRKGPRSSYLGCEAYLSIVDANNAPYDPSLDQLDIMLLCTNRDLPLMMPIGKGNTDFLLESGAPVRSVRCVAGPTEPRPSFASMSGDRSWRLISQLSLNYLSLTGSEGAGALKELLSLYQESAGAGAIDQSDAITDLECRPIMKRLTEFGPLSFGRGLEIRVKCDESRMAGSSPFLLGAVLSEFFSKYVSINSFTQTVLETSERGEVMRWPAIIGRRRVL